MTEASDQFGEYERIVFFLCKDVNMDIEGLV